MVTVLEYFVEIEGSLAEADGREEPEAEHRTSTGK